MTIPIQRDGWDAQHIKQLLDQPQTVAGHWVAEYSDCRFVFTAPEMPRYRAEANAGRCTIRAATKADVEADNARFIERAQADAAKWGSE